MRTTTKAGLNLTVRLLISHNSPLRHDAHLLSELKAL